MPMLTNQRPPPPAPSRPRRKRPPSLFTIARTIAVIAALVAALVWLYQHKLASLAPAGGDVWGLWPFIALGTWASDVKPVHLRSRRVNLGIGLAELPVLVGLIYLSPVLLLTSVSAGGIAASVFAKRKASKALISQASYALAVGVGVVFYDRFLHFLHARTPSTLLGWAAVGAAIVLVFLVDTVVVLVAVSLAEWHLWLPPPGKLALHTAMSLSTCFAGGMMAALLVGVNPWTAPLYSLVLWAAYRYYQNSREALRSYAEVAQVYELAREMIAQPSTRSVMEAAALRIAKVIHADRLEIVLPVKSPVGPILLRAAYRHKAGVSFVEEDDLSPRDRLALASVPFSERAGIADSELAACLYSEGFDDVMAASLEPDIVVREPTRWERAAAAQDGLPGSSKEALGDGPPAGRLGSADQSPGSSDQSPAVGLAGEARSTAKDEVPAVGLAGEVWGTAKDEPSAGEAANGGEGPSVGNAATAGEAPRAGEEGSAGGGPTYGYVIVSDPVYHNYEFSEIDEHFLQALAATLGVGLLSSEMLDGLRRELAAREYQAQHDPLTGLPNRSLFLRSLGHALSDEAAAVAAVLVDIDAFTDLNLTLGYQAGDAVLAEVGSRLADLGAPAEGAGDQASQVAVWFEGGSELLWRRLTKSKAEEGAARFDGDEFALVLTRSSRAELEAACLEVQESLGRPYEVSGLHLDMRLNVGAALALPGERGRDAAALLGRAELAAKQAKSSQSHARQHALSQPHQVAAKAGAQAAGEGPAPAEGRSPRPAHAKLTFYTPAEDTTERRQLALSRELRRSIDHGELQFWYQPVVGLSGGELAGCEALVRWQHETFGFVPPLELVTIAEGSGLIEQITWSAIETSLAELVQWRELVPELWVSVNLSGRVVPTTGFVRRIGEALGRHGLPPSALGLELTEAAAAAESLGTGRPLHELRDLGVKLALDDYGTGSYSLSKLRDMPFTDLKVDGLFVKNMVGGKADQAIVASTIELAHSLGRGVTAEGVEDEKTFLRLRELGCDAAQGFYVARPLPPVEFEEWLQRHAGEEACPAVAQLRAPAGNGHSAGGVGAPASARSRGVGAPAGNGHSAGGVGAPASARSRGVGARRATGTAPAGLGPPHRRGAGV